MNNVRSFQFDGGDPLELQEKLSRAVGWKIALSAQKPGAFLGTTAIRLASKAVLISGTYGSDLTAQALEPTPNLIIILIESGVAGIRCGGDLTGWTRDRIVFGNGHKEDNLHFLGRSKTLYFSVPISDYLAFSTRAYGEEVVFPFDVFGDVDAESGYGAYMRHGLITLWRHLEQQDRDDVPEFAVRSIEEALLVSTMDHFRSMSNRPDPGGDEFPRLVRVAMDLIDETTRPLLVSEVAEQLNVTMRALQFAFKNHLGVSPHDYVKRVRLKKLRSELAAGGPASLREAARYWGFTNTHRLMLDYVALFGRPEWDRLRYGDTPTRHQ